MGAADQPSDSAPQPDSPESLEPECLDQETLVPETLEDPRGSGPPKRRSTRRELASCQQSIHIHTAPRRPPPACPVASSRPPDAGFPRPLRDTGPGHLYHPYEDSAVAVGQADKQGP